MINYMLRYCCVVVGATGDVSIRKWSDVKVGLSQEICCAVKSHMCFYA